MKTLVFLLEEKSSKAMLEVVLPKIIPSGVVYRLISFEGKSDLENNLVRKIRGWRAPDSFFVVMRDQDSGNCREIKQRLVQKCTEAGRDDTLVRIACHELESFYLGDLNAVEQAYGITLPSQKSRKYRTPDDLANAKEELEKITRGEYQKIDGSRRIAEHLDLNGENRSKSFNALISGIKRQCS